MFPPVVQRVLVFGAALCLLPSCLLTQKAPDPAVDKSAAGGGLVGFVGMEDIRGAGVGAGIMAVFGRPAPSRAWGVRSGRFFGNQRSLEGSPTEIERAAGAFQCGMEKTDKVTPPARAITSSPSRAAASSGATFIDVGKLMFGIALQSTFMLFTESADHKYSRQLQPDVPAGVYQIEAEGADGVPSFGAILSMPEALHNVQANGTPFESPLSLKKSESLIVSWAAPTMPHDGNKLMLDFETETAAQKLVLHCWGDEKDSMTESSTLGWEIPPAALTELAAGANAKMYFVRGLVAAPKSKVLRLKLQGLRTYFGKVTLSE